MLADVSHDVLAAIIGGLALVVVATVPVLWRYSGPSAQKRNGEMLSVRERVDTLIQLEQDAAERRRAEHEELKAMLRILVERSQDAPIRPPTPRRRAD